MPHIANGLLVFGSWDCHVYAIDPATMKEVWRFTTSSQSISRIPPAYEAFKMEIKREVEFEDSLEEKEKYGESTTVSIESDYSSKSKYQVVEIIEVNEESNVETQIIPITNDVHFRRRF